MDDLGIEAEDGAGLDDRVHVPHRVRLWGGQQPLVGGAVLDTGGGDRHSEQ